MAVDLAKDKKEKQIAVVLLLVLVPLILWNVQRQNRAKRLREQFKATAVAPAAPLMAATSHAGSPPPSSSELESYVGTLLWKRDPFVFSLGEGGKTPTLQLKVSGIIFDESRPEATYAIINQEVVRIGDNFHGIKVIDIQPDYVRLKKFNEEILLNLYQEEENR